MPDPADGVLHRQSSGQTNLLVAGKADTEISDPAKEVLAGAVARIVQAYAGNGVGRSCTGEPAEAMTRFIGCSQSPVVLQHEREVCKQVDGVAVSRLGVDVGAQTGEIGVATGQAFERY